MEAIKVDGLTKKFKGVIAVEHISFSVPVGELFGLLGPNRAGKTTTINMLSTLLKPTSGQGEVAGLDITRDRDSVRLSIGALAFPMVFNLGIMIAFSLVMIILGAHFFEKSESV